MGKGIGGHSLPNNGATDDWQTPPYILESLGPFNDDPCPIGGCGGLLRPWRGYVWLNPPYGTKTAQWVGRLAEHGSGIALIFARTETQLFFDYIWGKAQGIMFLKGRVRFLDKDGIPGKWTGGAPSVLVSYGCYAASRLMKSGLNGAFVALNNKKECLEPIEDCPCAFIENDESDYYPEPCSFCGGSGEVDEVCSETGKKSCPECRG